MQFQPNIISLLTTLGVGASQRQEAGQCLSEFDRLSIEEKKNNLSATIEKIFPIVFTEAAAVRTSDRFQDLHQKPWSTNCWLSPKVIVSPSSAQEVSKVVGLCRFLGAVFSIRGGGHLQNPGFCSNDGGVVISLSQFRGVTVSDDRKTASLGVGLTWHEVYRELDKFDLAVTGGRMPTVGVSGLLLGGGLSFFVAKNGFSCSGVVNFEVVLADCTIVNASANENSDLFWALKGGASNFGVVTGIQMSTIPDTAWGETRLFYTSENDKLIQTLMKYHKLIETDDKASLYYYSVKELTLLTLFYADTTETRPAIFDCFYDIPHMMSGMEPGPKKLLDVIDGIAQILDNTQKFHEMRTLTSLPDLELYQVAEDLRKKKLEELQDVEGLALCLSFQPIGPSAMRATNARGGTPMSIPEANHQWMLTMADWTHEKDEIRVRAACKEICDAAQTTAEKNGTAVPFVYPNYASRDQNPMASYGEENLAKLWEISRRYDPQGIFQKLQNGGWLLSKA